MNPRPADYESAALPLSYLGPVVIKGLIPSPSRNLASHLRCSRRISPMCYSRQSKKRLRIDSSLLGILSQALGFTRFRVELDLAGRHLYSPSFSPDLRAADPASRAPAVSPMLRKRPRGDGLRAAHVRSLGSFEQTLKAIGLAAFSFPRDSLSWKLDGNGRRTPAFFEIWTVCPARRRPLAIRTPNCHTISRPLLRNARFSSTSGCPSYVTIRDTTAERLFISLQKAGKRLHAICKPRLWPREVQSLPAPSCII